MTTVSTPDFLGLREIDWDDTGSILRGALPIFDRFAGDATVLDDLLAGLATDQHLRGLCERYDFLDKLVLHDDPVASIRVRLHLYRPGYFDRPHNHRWSFASHILRGSYRHRVFGRDDTFCEDTDPGTLQPIHERIESKGATYALHHTSVHTVQAEADSISILLRGPAAKRRFLILDRDQGPFWVYGADQETPEQRANKQMTLAQVDEAIAAVQRLTSVSDDQPGSGN